ncbi:hypothetical protein DFH09DRAFT_1472225 [Mycena vulgaris]|nr:hypothetical protein DFH09DRAFT_1472225 [Mycena vulgaris]
MSGGQQEDAEEFLGFLLDPLEEELLVLAPAVVEAQNGWLEDGRKNRAIIVTRTVHQGGGMADLAHLGSKFRSMLLAAGQKDSVIIEAWRTLRLDIQVRFLPSLALAHRRLQHDTIHTIQDALSFIAHPQVVQMGAADASLQILIVALPPVLVLPVKRKAPTV